ncbi:MAG: tRNA (adenosine(37)-N6)-threonylcarbamoyltransferase complex dimerization subunit type 1 TsaB [Salinisphaeraceae bacterium]|nr:tRNA (adenosine(37)-N6)-threonylcarbamoyltransferase complex dimerization subunit type 1 TsaB [Salinisphaeraceae bacterium]
MNILALESSGDSCSVALYLNGQVHERMDEANAQQHSRRLLPMQQQLLGEAGKTLKDVDLICCANGPGSFTGVRVATALTQGLAYAADLPVVGVSTLACMAYAARKQGYAQALVLLDARMGEVYWAHYRFENGLLRTLQSESLSKPSEVPSLALENCIGIGNGWSAYTQSLEALVGQCESLDAGLRPSAALVAELAATQLKAGEISTQSPAELEPLSVRNQVTHQQKRAG